MCLGSLFCWTCKWGKKWEVSTEITYGVWARIACQLWSLSFYLEISIPFLPPHTLASPVGWIATIISPPPESCHLQFNPAYSCQNTVPKAERCLIMWLAKTAFPKPKTKIKTADYCATLTTQPCMMKWEARIRPPRWVGSRGNLKGQLQNNKSMTQPWTHMSTTEYVHGLRSNVGL